MTYGIITHYDVHNHGAILQLNALVQVLRGKFGMEAAALRFDKNYDFLGRELKSKYEVSLRSAGIYLNYLKENGWRRMLFNVKKKRLLESFKTRERLVGNYYTECGKLDGVIIGSDEVFALHTGPTPVFFGHGCPADKVFSYAGSFGPTTIEDVDRLNCRALVSSGLRSMAGLSVRDRNSMRIVRDLTGREPVPVCDPVILYGYEREMAAFPPVNLPPYLLVYAYDRNMNDPAEVERIRTFARRHGLKIVSPGFYHQWADWNVNADPVELLRYFKNARFVVTDTFHGCVMSIITERNMAVKLRGNENKLFNLLEEYGLTGRILSDDWNLDALFSGTVNYETLHGEVLRRRGQSMSYLNQMMNL